jgi:hypothetical protein
MRYNEWTEWYVCTLSVMWYLDKHQVENIVQHMSCAFSFQDTRNRQLVKVVTWSKHGRLALKIGVRSGLGLFQGRWQCNLDILSITPEHVGINHCHNFVKSCHENWDSPGWDCMNVLLLGSLQENITLYDVRFQKTFEAERGEACWGRLADYRRAVFYSLHYAAPSTINSLYLAQHIFRLFLSYSVQSGNSAVGLNSYWLIANVF